MKTIRKTIYTHRLLARVVIEAKTPLSIGTGTESFLTDSLVALDTNGLPYIPATAIAGTFRHFLKEDANKIFGYQATNKENDGEGSRIIFSSAQMVGKNKKVIDGIENIDYNDPFYHHFLYLPIRQHTRINSKGTSENGGKYDEQIVFKGARFCFEIEIIGTEDEVNKFNRIKDLLQLKAFRLGSGTRCGYGEISVVEYQEKILNLSGSKKDLESYLCKSSDLSDDSFWQSCPKTPIQQTQYGDWVSYKIELTPDNFFLFGSGYGNDVADITPVTSTIITWDKKEAEFEKQCILLPASSIKGALSHRIAYHYNVRNKIFADKISETEYEKHIGINNVAVKTLFGCEANSKKKDVTGLRGNVIFSDVILSNESASTKILNHVAIDRFTGGAIKGALFHELVNSKMDHPFTLILLVYKTALTDANIEYALETTLKDLCSGRLPLGGGSNRGHGCFTGTLKKNDQFINIR